jgi:hypothetical protein
MPNRSAPIPPPDAAAAAEKSGGLLARLRGIGILPAVVITCIAVVALGNLGFLIQRVVEDRGLMPRPTAMESYACKGFAVPFTLDFRHGMDTVKLRVPSVTLEGKLLNGKMEWIGLSAVSPPLGFVPPTEITYDDSSSLRVLDTDQVERICQRVQ